MQAATLTLLGLIIGFSFSMAIGRYDLRRTYEEAEANAIGTEYEGDHPPKALYELFRDWQRTQTQSSVTALQGTRLQMDVWFCRVQEPMPRGTLCALNILERMICTLS